MMDASQRQPQLYDYGHHGPGRSTIPPNVAPEQEMVYQWVDLPPSYGRSPMQQPMPQMGMAHTPYGQSKVMPSTHQLDLCQSLAPSYSQGPNDPDAHPAARFQVPGQVPYPQQDWRGATFDESQNPRGWNRYQDQYDSPQRHNQAPRQPAGDFSRRPPHEEKPQSRKNGTNSSGHAGATPTNGRRGAKDSNEPDLQMVLKELGATGLATMLSSALSSLYTDRIRPLASYLKGRLKEKACPEAIVSSFVDLYSKNTETFQVQKSSDSDEMVIFFVNEPSGFKGWVDIDSAEDPYDEAMWEQFEKFLDGEQTFAGGRYGMARELMSRNLSFLAGYTLGEAIHIVQLAIQSRKLIVYHRKLLKPMQTVMAQSQGSSPDGSPSEGKEIKDKDELLSVVFQLLKQQGKEGMQLSRVKQMIKHLFNLHLSEMSFQCTKLIELFNQEPLDTTFTLSTEGGKSIYVRLGNPEKFSDHVKQIYEKTK